MFTLKHKLKTDQKNFFSKKKSFKRKFLVHNLIDFIKYLDFFLLDGFDDSDSDGLTHVTDSEASKRSVGLEGLDAHRLGGDHTDNGGITYENIFRKYSYYSIQFI